MLKVGRSKPKLAFSPASNDMSHFFPSHYYVNDYFIMELYDFIEKKSFDSFNMKPDFSKEQIKEILERIQNPKTQFDDIACQITNPWEFQLRSLIKKSGGYQIWQFNAVNKNMTDYVRQIVVLGDSTLLQWNWIDVNIKFPVLRLVVNILNFFRIRKVRKEIATWDAFVKSVRSKNENLESKRSD